MDGGYLNASGTAFSYSIWHCGSRRIDHGDQAQETELVDREIHIITVKLKPPRKLWGREEQVAEPWKRERKRIKEGKKERGKEGSKNSPRTLSPSPPSSMYALWNASFQSSSIGISSPLIIMVLHLHYQSLITHSYWLKMKMTVNNHRYGILTNQQSLQLVIRNSCKKNNYDVSWINMCSCLLIANNSMLFGYNVLCYWYLLIF